jgi:alkylation response protein AidB-like acyl-CoA dehydrogenase
MIADPEQRAFTAVIADLARARIEPQACDVDERSRFPESGYQGLASVGLLVLHLPEEVGGGGGAMATSVRAIEQVARVCGSTAAVVAATVPVGTALEWAGGAMARARIEQIASGHHVASWVGEGVSYTSTGRGYVLHGRGTWVANADRADSLVVVADPERDTDTGVAVVAVATDQGGVRVGEIETDLGLRGCSLRRVDFDGVLVSPGALLLDGAGARAAVDAAAANHALAVAALCVGLAQGSLDQARSYVLERVQFARRIADFPAVRAILSGALVRVDGARALLRVAAEQVEAGAARDYAISAALLAATETAAEVTIDAVQAFGGYGYVRPYPVERMMRDAHLARLLIGSRAGSLESVARHFLGRQVHQPVRVHAPHTVRGSHDQDR